MSILFLTVLFVIDISLAIDKETLQDWHIKVTNPEYKCPGLNNENQFLNQVENIDGSLILKVVNCNEPSAIFRYDYKVCEIEKKPL